MWFPHVGRLAAANSAFNRHNRKRTLVRNRERQGPFTIQFRMRAAGRAAVAMIAASGLIGCVSPINQPPARYVVQGNYEDIASCLYREAEGVHALGRDVHLTRLSNPQEIRVALLRTTSRGGIAWLAWEIELMPHDRSTARLLVRQASTLVDAQPFWSSVLEPAITRCAGSRPVPA